MFSMDTVWGSCTTNKGCRDLTKTLLNMDCCGDIRWRYGIRDAIRFASLCLVTLTLLLLLSVIVVVVVVIAAAVVVVSLIMLCCERLSHIYGT